MLLLLWMGVIFYFSAQVQSDSASSSNLVTDLLYRLYAALSRAPVSREGFVALFAQPVRKLAHFGEFLILGVLARLNAEEHLKKDRLKWSCLFSVAYAFSDEFHQYFVQGRYCSLKDVAIDSLGAVTGIFLCHLIMKGCQKRNS